MFEYMIKRAVYEDARDGKGIVGMIGFLTKYVVVGIVLAVFGFFSIAPVVVVAALCYPLAWKQSGERPSIQRWIALTINDLRFDDNDFSTPGSIAITTFLFAFPLYVFADSGIGPAALAFIVALAALGLIAKGVDKYVNGSWQPPE